MMRPFQALWCIPAEQLAKIEINEKGDKIRYPYEGSAFVMEKQ